MEKPTGVLICSARIWSTSFRQRKAWKKLSLPRSRPSRRRLVQRAVREQQDFREFAAAEVIKNFLPPLDSFERALKGASSDSSDFRNGIDLIYRQFQDALQKIGVQPIPAVGQPFDPRVHEAVEMVDSTEVPDHHVFDELQRGYKYKDRLLRPAMVRVARNTHG